LSVFAPNFHDLFNLISNLKMAKPRYEGYSEGTATKLVQKSFGDAKFWRRYIESRKTPVNAYFRFVTKVSW
jgi:hypothetical protein